MTPTLTPRKGKLSYRLLGASMNGLRTGDFSLDANGAGRIPLTVPYGGLFALEVTDGKSSEYCRIMATPSRPDPEERLAAQKAIAAQRGTIEPTYTEVEKGAIYTTLTELAKKRNPPTEKNKNDAQLTESSFRAIGSPLTPAVLFDVPQGKTHFFADLSTLGMGGPTHLALPAKGGPKVIKSGDPAAPADLAENWILVWFNGAEGWNKLKRGGVWCGNVFNDDSVLDIDFPHVLIFESRPQAIETHQTDGLTVTFAERAKALLVPLYGRDKPFSERTRGWATSLPDEVVEQCRRWVKALAYVPVDVHEYYAIDGANGDVIVTNVYDYVKFRPDAKDTEVAAPVPPCTALAADAGGDLATYHRNVHLAAKILIGEAAWIQGARPYVQKHLPWDQSCLNDAIPVELSNVQGFHFGGINNKSQSPIEGTAYDGVHENFWVFGGDELLRFWRDHLKEGTKHILDVYSNRAFPGWEDITSGIPGQKDSPLHQRMWSLMKMKLLVLEEPEDRVDYLVKRVHYTLWTGPDGATSLPHVFSTFLNGREYRQIIPPPEGEPRFIKASTRLGADYIAGGLGAFSDGLGIYQPAFMPPKPRTDWKWEFTKRAIYSGFHRNWEKGEKTSRATIHCGNAKIRIFDRP